MKVIGGKYVLVSTRLRKGVSEKKIPIFKISEL